MEEVVLLFPQETENYGLLQNYKRSDLTKGELLRILAADMSEEVQKDCRTGHGCAPPFAWEQPLDWMRHDKSCWLQSLQCLGLIITWHFFHKTFMEIYIAL